MPLILTVGRRVFIEESSPLSLPSAARQLVRTQLAAQDDLVLIVLSPGVEIEVSPDGGETQLVGDPETRPAQSLERWFGTQLAHHIALGTHLLSSLLSVEGKVGHSHLLIMDLAVVIHQLLAEDSLSSRIVSLGLTLRAGYQDVVTGPHVLLQLIQL